MTDLLQIIKDICTVGAQKHGAVVSNPVMCDDCDEQPATETWDYSDAPIPVDMIPPPDHFCEGCADKRRDRWLERHS